MKLVREKVSREAWAGVGYSEELDKYLLHIPVSNKMIDYLEYYIITEVEFKVFTSDSGLSSLKSFADECRQHKHDDRLLRQPGTDRGS
ncbi:MAG: hypothetical protein EOP04_14935 [Proteobacteria bacterium]|nr:MAG: hypothetical protein EOP04_14935 [Pseudomonadota bacterium]